MLGLAEPSDQQEFQPRGTTLASVSPCVQWGNTS